MRITHSTIVSLLRALHVFLLATSVIVTTGFVANAQISGEVRGGKIFVSSDSPTELVGVDLKSNDSLLVPVSLESGAAPFQFLLANSPRQITWGNLGTNVLLDGEWATGAGYTGTDPGSDLTSNWGVGEQLNTFPITIASSGTPNNPPVVQPGIPPVVPLPIDPKTPSLAISVNNEDRFVLHANQYELNSLSFNSSSGGLIPAENSAPFPALLSNNAQNIGYYSESPLTLDGNLTLSAGWRPKQNDLRVEHSVVSNGRPRLQVVHSGEVPACVGCESTLNVSFNDDQRFVLNGNNHQLTALDFRSNGNLVPAESAAPFVSLESNSVSHIGYRALEGVVIDGAVTLSSGWNANGTVGDIRYEYTDTTGERTGMLAIPNAYYLQDRHLDAIVNDENRIVLTGTGHQVNSVNFTSRSQSLVPGTSSLPFDSIGANSKEEVMLFNSNGNVTLDGEIALDIGWDPSGEQDIRFKYDGVGNFPDGGYYLSRGSYPTGTDEPRPDVWVSLDQDYKLIVHADGKRLMGVEVNSPDASLIPAAAADPFSILLKNEPARITLGELLPGLTVDGSIKTEVQINPLLDSETLQVAYGDSHTPTEIEVLDTDLAICPGCAVPEVSFAAGGQMWIEGFESSLTSVNVFSESGSLVPLTLDASDFALAFASSSEVRLAAAEGVDAFLRQTLPVAWDTLGTDDIIVEFTTLEGTQLGPFPLAVEAYDAAVPEPSGLAMVFIGALSVLAMRRRRQG